MDLDATAKDADVNKNTVKKMIADVINVKVNDNVTFESENVSDIMDEADYPGIRVGATAYFDGTRTPLKTGITTGDAITPREIRRSFKLMFEDRSIELLAYNTETVLAEKPETVISRAATNTRMRDFYDIAVLTELYKNSINPKDLQNALNATARRRGTEKLIINAKEVFKEIENSKIMLSL